MPCLLPSFNIFYFPRYTSIKEHLEPSKHFIKKNRNNRLFLSAIVTETALRIEPLFLYKIGLINFMLDLIRGNQEGGCKALRIGLYL